MNGLPISVERSIAGWSQARLSTDTGLLSPSTRNSLGPRTNSRVCTLVLRRGNRRPDTAAGPEPRHRLPKPP